MPSSLSGQRLGVVNSALDVASLAVAGPLHSLCMSRQHALDLLLQSFHIGSRLLRLKLRLGGAGLRHLQLKGNNRDTD